MTVGREVRKPSCRRGVGIDAIVTKALHMLAVVVWMIGVNSSARDLIT